MRKGFKLKHNNIDMIVKIMFHYSTCILVSYVVFFWAMLVPMCIVMSTTSKEFECFNGNYTKAECIEIPYIWHNFAYCVMIFYMLHFCGSNILLLHLLLQRYRKPSHPPQWRELLSMVSNEQQSLSPIESVR